uniref:Uncharacterized protein n=1 Tax=Setaria italica TaxID=4555 RepID=K4A236_SETIT
MFACFCDCRKQCLKGSSFTSEVDFFLWRLVSAGGMSKVFRLKVRKHVLIVLSVQDGAEQAGVSLGTVPCAQQISFRKVSFYYWEDVYIMSFFCGCITVLLTLVQESCSNRTNGPWM